ncbi:response regulator transcription factor [Pseudoramibacter alactolyticus]|jgi:DNA-binding response OmpR family regulator
MKLLFAEDTTDLNRVVTMALVHAGYEVDSVMDGQKALSHLQTQVYDAAILDIMMPGLSGLAVTERIRAAGDTTPILLLTAKTEVDDRVTGLEAGADDYLPKPFALKELMARVKAMIRGRETTQSPRLEFGDLSLDTDTQTLTAENSVTLSQRECALLRLFILHPDTALPADYLLDHVWRHDTAAARETVTLYLSYLRAKLEAVASQVLIAEPEPGHYRIMAS